MSLNLSEETLSALKECFESISNETLKPLLSFTFAVLLKEENRRKKISNLAGKVDPVSFKRIISGLSAFILEGAKRNADSSSLKSLLMDNSASQEQFSTFASVYDAQIPQLRSHLSEISFSFPQLVDVDWRLDYVMKTDHVDKANQPLFFIKLKAQSRDQNNGDLAPTTMKTVEFTCDRLQLQHLVSKLKDAVKSVERSIDEIDS